MSFCPQLGTPRMAGHVCEHPSGQAGGPFIRMLERVEQTTTYQFYENGSDSRSVVISSLPSGEALILKRTTHRIKTSFLAPVTANTGTWDPQQLDHLSLGLTLRFQPAHFLQVFLGAASAGMRFFCRCLGKRCVEKIHNLEFF